MRGEDSTAPPSPCEAVVVSDGTEADRRAAIETIAVGELVFQIRTPEAPERFAGERDGGFIAQQLLQAFDREH